MNRRELLFGGAAVFCCGGCATVPAPHHRIEGGTPAGAPDRPCDNDMCRAWRPLDGAPSVDAQPPGGEPRPGRCSVGVPEDP